MATQILKDFRNLKDDASVCTDGAVDCFLAGTVTPQAMYADKDLGVSLGTSISTGTLGYPVSGGSYTEVWVPDDVSVDVRVRGTGVTTRTINYYTQAETTTAEETSSEILMNPVENGAFDSWSGGASFSNISGSGTGVETADGWYFTQPSAAANSITRATAQAIGSDPAFSRYGARIQRPNGSSVTNEMRFWKILRPEDCFRLRGKAVTLRFTCVAGANFSGTGLAVRVATGTTASESGDLIDSGGFAGHANPIDQTQSITTTVTRYEFDATLGATIQEIGIQFSYVPVGTAGANDWFQIQDVEIKEAADSEEFISVPESIAFLRTKLSTLGRRFVAFAAADPDADRIIFWDDSAGDFAFLTASTGLSISGTSLALDLSITPTWTGAHTHAAALLFSADNTHDIGASGATRPRTLHVGTSIELGHATQNTLTASGGALSIEGNLVPHVASSPAWTGAHTFNSGGSVPLTLNSTQQYTILFQRSNATVGYVGCDSTFWYLFDSGGVARAYVTWATGAMNVGALTASSVVAPVTASGETSGTLTSASANRTVKATGDITINDGVFAAEDRIEIYAGGSARSIIQDTGMTLRLDGTSTTGTRTLAARGRANIYFVSNTEAIVSGSGVS